MPTRIKSTVKNTRSGLLFCFVSGVAGGADNAAVKTASGAVAGGAAGAACAGSASTGTVSTEFVISSAIKGSPLFAQSGRLSFRSSPEALASAVWQGACPGAGLPRPDFRYHHIIKSPLFQEPFQGRRAPFRNLPGGGTRRGRALSLRPNSAEGGTPPNAALAFSRKSV